MTPTYKIIAICGQAGSGKDSIMKETLLINPNLHEIVSCTTRPPREGEVDGINYHFLTNEQFAEKVLNGDMLEATVFNDWCYGTAKSSLSLDKINIGVFNPEGIENLLEYHPTLNLKIFAIDCPSKERLLRQLNRELDPDVEEILRRWQTDRNDFRALPERFPHTVLYNVEPYDLQTCAREIAGQTF